MLTTTLHDIIEQVKSNQSVMDKMAIYRTHASIGDSVSLRDPFSSNITHTIPVGDDCAAIPDGNGSYMLFAAEGIIPAFVQSHPWFAGYSAVMVNISDVCAMGGLPLAVTDTIWAKDEDDSKEIWQGMKAASEAYGVPIVGGHTCYGSPAKHLGVAVLGKANKLLTSYDAEDGDVLMMAIDLNGSYFESYPFWNASTSSDSLRLQNNMRLMYQIAEKGLAKAAKDISMGGVVGTLAMLLHTSEVGATLELDSMPIPSGVDWEKWLVSFPSFGYLITTKQDNVVQIKDLFESHQIACSEIGAIHSEKGLRIAWMDEVINVL